MRTRLLGRAGVPALLAGRSTGADRVDVDNGGGFRFAEGTAAGEVIPAGGRASAPDVGGRLLDGPPSTSADLDGDVAVLDFWGSWCAPCRVGTPAFQEVHAQVRDEGVQFLGPDVREPSEQLAPAFVERFGIEFPSLDDPRGEVARAFRDCPATAIPSTIVPDPQRRVAAVYTGPVSHEDLRGVIDSVLEED